MMFASEHLLTAGELPFGPQRNQRPGTTTTLEVLHLDLLLLTSGMLEEVPEAVKQLVSDGHMMRDGRSGWSGAGIKARSRQTGWL